MAVVPGSRPEAFSEAVLQNTAESAVVGAFPGEQMLLFMFESGSSDAEITGCPATLDETVWVYEHFRLFLTHLHRIIALLGDASLGRPACSPATCPVMTMGEIQYLCASHAQPRTCSAIDYMIHTVDGAAALLASTHIFPSRVSMRQMKDAAFGHYANLARRLYRCLSHTWRHHPAVFREAEDATGAAARFTALTRRYGLLGEDQFVIDAGDLGRRA